MEKKHDSYDVVANLASLYFPFLNPPPPLFHLSNDSSNPSFLRLSLPTICSFFFGSPSICRYLFFPLVRFPSFLIACWFSSSEFSSSLHSDNHDRNGQFSKRTLMYISSQIPFYISLLNHSIYPCLILSPLFLLDLSNFSGFSLFAHAFIYYFYLLRLWSW